MTDAKRLLIALSDSDLAKIIARRCQDLGLEVDCTCDAPVVHKHLTETAADPSVAGTVIVDDILAGEVLDQLQSSPDFDNEARPPRVILVTQSRLDNLAIIDSPWITATIERSYDLWPKLRPFLLNQGTNSHAERNDRANRRLDPPSNERTQTTTTEPERAPVADSAPPARPLSDVNVMQFAERLRSDYVDSIFSSLGWSEDNSADGAAGEPADERPLRSIVRPWVLCIDDDVNFANTLKMRLNQFGLDVIQAFAGMTGYRYAFTHEAQAIILDQDMPGGNGDYILRRLKENPVTKEIPVIVLTGRKEPLLARRVYNLGAAAFFNKPPNWSELCAELKRHIREPVGA